MFGTISKKIIKVSILVSSIALSSCGGNDDDNSSTVNTAPVAVNDNFSVNKGKTLEIGNTVNSILANDSDPDGDMLLASKVEDVSFGVLSLNQDGSFRYTHDDSDNLNDSFTYKASDGQLNSEVVTVNITIDTVNESPVASADAYSGVVGGTLTIPAVDGVLKNDSDPENSTLAAIETSSVNFGVLTLNPDGSFSYTHDGSGNLNDSFTYQASDGQLNSAIVTVSITVTMTPINNAPVAVADVYNSVSEGATLVVSVTDGVLKNDSDPDGDATTANLNSGVSFGALSLNSNGSFSYTHDGSENFSDSFTYRAFDGQLSSDAVIVSISVTAVNENPVAVADTYSGVNEGGALVVAVVDGLLKNDSDPDGDAITASLNSGVSFGSLSLNSNGSFSYTHDGSENFSDSFTYRVSDGALTSSVVTVSIAISAVNEAPVAVADTYNGINKGGTLTINVANGVLDNDSDPENDVFTASLIDDVNFGTLTLDTDGSFSYTHDGSTNLTDSFTYRATDGNSASNTVTVTINIADGVNQSPVASSSCSTTAQSSTKNGSFDATDPDGDLLTFKLGADGSDGSGPMNTNRGSVVITNSTTGAYTYTPSSSGPRGSDSFTFYVEDTNGGSTTAIETIVVDQKIMPLGDSVTRGSGDGSATNSLKVGYRKPLYDSLNSAGFDFDFVGNDSATGGGVSNFDSDNEGHSGWKAIEIAFGGTGSHTNDPPGDVRDWLDDNPADIVLLHIGTNDGPVAGTEDDVEALLDEIDRWENSSNGNPVTVILAKIVDQNPLNSDVTDFNIALGLMAAARATDDIKTVDMQAALSYPADLDDAVHPNSSGYAKMAPVWHDELVNIMDKCP